MEPEQDLTERLEQLGRSPVPPRVSSVQLAGMAAVTPRRSRHRFPAVAAGVLVAALLGTGIAAASMNASQPATTAEDPDATVPAVADAEQEAADEENENGPPFAVPPGDVGEGVVDPFPDDPCRGPPPFAGQPAVTPGDDGRGTTRAAEAEAFSAIRGACEAEGDGSDGGPPPGTPQGPPPGTPDGPPSDTPSGPPSDTPDGPPANTPSGPPPGTPQGPPEDTPPAPGSPGS
jgi:hypothetical protein